MRRLHTFRAITWFCKPPGAGPVDCARRGWVNVSADMLGCEVPHAWHAPCCKSPDVMLGRMHAELTAACAGLCMQFCKARLSLPIPPSMPAEEVLKVCILCWQAPISA